MSSIISRMNIFILKTYGHDVRIKKIKLLKKDYEELVMEYQKRGIDMKDGVKFMGIDVEMFHEK